MAGESRVIHPNAKSDKDFDHQCCGYATADRDVIKAHRLGIGDAP
jgi:hypothetical protein